MIEEPTARTATGRKVRPRVCTFEKTDTAWQTKRGKYENLSTVERKNLRAAELGSRGLQVPKNPKDDKALPEQLHSRYKNDMWARMAMPAATKDSQEGKNPNSPVLEFSSSTQRG